jgi:hypothetical protein
MKIKELRQCDRFMTALIGRIASNGAVVEFSTRANRASASD